MRKIFVSYPSPHQELWPITHVESFDYQHKWIYRAWLGLNQQILTYWFIFLIYLNLLSQEFNYRRISLVICRKKYIYVAKTRVILRIILCLLFHNERPSIQQNDKATNIINRTEACLRQAARTSVLILTPEFFFKNRHIFSALSSLKGYITN